MLKWRRFSFGGGFAGVFAITAAACGTPAEQSAQGVNHAPINAVETVGDAREETPGTLEGAATTAEAAGLKWMREEEKLARDVYLNSFDRYGLRIFENISASEQRHMDAVRTLIDARGLPDPAAGTGRGEFRDPTLSALFASLNAKSAASEASALAVGAEIEEIDIKDLNTQMALTDDPEILRVYENLARGSRNHLRAFIRNLNRRGVSYTPLHLDTETFAEIIAHEQERGHGRGGGRH